MKAPRIIHADCLDALRAMDACSVDAIVTDPPAGIAFMGKAWDKDKGGRTEWVAWMAEIARECLRVIKPGGHALVWALPRTSHWTGWAWEDAGWQPRDKVVHLYGSGFPKSLDVSKAIDKAAGAAREVLESRHAAVGFDTKKEGGGGWSAGVVNVTAPATEAARQWQGWGSALKPAAEDWWLMRKPLDGTIAANVIKHGTGAINVDGCRVGTDTITTHRPIAQSNSKVLGKFGGGPTTHHTGRWPANVTLDAEAAASLGESARFFYVAKPSRSERDAGCDELEPQQRDEGRVAGGGEVGGKDDRLLGHDLVSASTPFYAAAPEVNAAACPATLPSRGRAGRHLEPLRRWPRPPCPRWSRTSSAAGRGWPRRRPAGRRAPRARGTP